MLRYANAEPEFKKTIMAGDDIWVYGYDPETKTVISVENATVK